MTKFVAESPSYLRATAARPVPPILVLMTAASLLFSSTAQVALGGRFGASFYDEMALLLSLTFCIFRGILTSKLAGGLILYVGLGLIGNIRSGSLVEGVMGAWTGARFFLVMWVFCCLRIDVERALRTVRVLGTVCLAGALLNLSFRSAWLPSWSTSAIGVGMGDELLRSREVSLRGFFPHPGIFASAAVSLALALLILPGLRRFDSPSSLLPSFREYGWVDSALAAGLVLSALLTFRLKPIIDLLIAALVTAFVAEGQFRRKVRQLAMRGAVLGALLFLLKSDLLNVAWSQITRYGLGGRSSGRSKILDASWRIASDYSPFGSGFGTFASAESVRRASPLFDRYGVADLLVAALEGRGNFVQDAQWASSLAETGFIGVSATLCYLIWLARSTPPGLSRALVCGLLTVVVVEGSAAPTLSHSSFTVIPALVVASLSQASRAPR